MRQGDRLSHVFRVRNAGSAPLRIAGVDHLYSCAAVDPPERIGQGESVDLEVVCDTQDREDLLVDKVTVRSDDPLLPELALEVRARIEPLLAFESRTMELSTAFGGTNTQEIRLTGVRAMDARLAVRSADPPGSVIATIAAEKGKPQGLRLTLTGTRVGRAAGRIELTSGLPKPETLTLLYSWQVTGNLNVSPTNPYIDLGAPKPGGVTVQVSSSRPDFRLDGAVITDGPFEATFARDESTHAYAVRVGVLGNQVPAEQRGLLGKLRLVSNDPAEPQKELSIFALGAIHRNP